MKHISKDCCCMIAAIFIFPATFFIAGSALKPERGLPVFYDMAEPLLISLGLNEKLGLNANLLMGFGPIVALGLTLFSLVNDRKGNQVKTVAGNIRKGS